MENARKSSGNGAGMEKTLVLARGPHKRIFFFKLVIISKRQDATCLKRMNIR